MCYSCLRYGHVSSDCKGKPRCQRCGSQKHPNIEDCPRAHLPPSCCNCGGGEHLPSSPGCPTYVRQKQIYAYATIENLSYTEARLKFGSATRSNASSPPNFFHHKDFPSLSKSPHPPVPSRSSPSYEDLLTSNNISAPTEFQHFAGRSYADIASTASPHISQNSSVSPIVSSSWNKSQYSSAQFKHSNNHGEGKTRTHGPTEAYRNFQEAHKSLLYAPNGRYPNFNSSPPPLSYPHSPPSSLPRYPSSSPPTHSSTPSSSSFTPPSQPFSPSFPAEWQQSGLASIIQLILSWILQWLSNNNLDPNLGSSFGTGLTNFLNVLQTIFKSQ